MAEGNGRADCDGVGVGSASADRPGVGVGSASADRPGVVGSGVGLGADVLGRDVFLGVELPAFTPTI